MSEVQQSVLSDTERMINTGIEIELKKLGKVTVKELSLEKIIKLASSVKMIMDELSKNEGDGGTAAIFLLMESPSFLASIRKVAAATTGKEVSDFEEMPVKDWLKLIKAFKEVMDWEEMQELFFQIVPLAVIRGMSATE